MQVQMYNIYVYMGFYFTGMTKKIREKREVGRLEEEVWYSNLSPKKDDIKGKTRVGVTDLTRIWFGIHILSEGKHRRYKSGIRSSSSYVFRRRGGGGRGSGIWSIDIGWSSSKTKVETVRKGKKRWKKGRRRRRRKKLIKLQDWLAW